MFRCNWGRTIHKCVKKDLRTLTKPSNLIELAAPQRIESITVRNNDMHYPQYRPFAAFYRCGADGIRAHARSLPGLRLRTDKLRAPRDEQAGLEGGVPVEEPR